MERDDLIWVPPGSFEQGADERYWSLPGPTGDPLRLSSELHRHGTEKPVHTVTISRGFWLTRTPVTVAQYREFCRKTGRKLPPAPSFDRTWSKEEHPIVNVTWREAEVFARWAGGMLPTEAQWEYAARNGGKRVRYPWGDLYDNGRLWSSTFERRNGTAPVTRKTDRYVNALGLMDMIGNVWEWCADWFGLYTDGPKTDPTGPPRGIRRVTRGGAWTTNFDGGDAFRCTFRGFMAPQDYDENRGFRIAFPPEAVTIPPPTASHL